jgi:hypothetical protein
MDLEKSGLIGAETEQGIQRAKPDQAGHDQDNPEDAKNYSKNSKYDSTKRQNFQRNPRHNPKDSIQARLIDLDDVCHWYISFEYRPVYVD